MLWKKRGKKRELLGQLNPSAFSLNFLIMSAFWMPQNEMHDNAPRNRIRGESSWVQYRLIKSLEYDQ